MNTRAAVYTLSRQFTPSTSSGRQNSSLHAVATVRTIYFEWTPEQQSARCRDSSHHLLRVNARPAVCTLSRRFAPSTSSERQTSSLHAVATVHAIYFEWTPEQQSARCRDSSRHLLRVDTRTAVCTLSRRFPPSTLSERQNSSLVTLHSIHTRNLTRKVAFQRRNLSSCLVSSAFTISTQCQMYRVSDYARMQRMCTLAINATIKHDVYWPTNMH